MNYEYCCNKVVTVKLNLYRPSLRYDFFPRDVFHFSPIKSDRFRLRSKDNNNNNNNNSNIVTIIVMASLLIMI